MNKNENLSQKIDIINTDYKNSKVIKDINNKSSIKKENKHISNKPMKNLLRRRSILKKKLFEKPDFIEQILNKDTVNSFDFIKSNPEIYKILLILTQKYNRRLKKENELIFSFLTKIKMQEVIKSDLLESNLSWEQLYSYIKPYIFGKINNYYDTLFYCGNDSDLLYIIIYGKVCRYTLVEYTKSVTCEEYLLFLSNCYLKYHKMLKDGPIENNKKDNNNNNNKPKKIIKNEENNKKNEDEEEIEKLELKDDEYIDEYLLKQIVEKNKEIYPLHSITDIDKLNEIIFKLKLFSVLSEEKYSDTIDLFEKYKFPITFLGYDKVIEHQMTPQLFLQKLNKSLGTKGRYYMKQLGLIPQQVKLLKFVKKDILEPYNFFGNFEIIDCAPKRKYTTRIESDKCIFICIDKKMYSSILFEIQKNKRENEITLFHSDYLFKNINIHYFTTKIFSHFKINNLFKGDVIFNQEKNMNRFILVKEGIIEILLQNISFFELNQLIKKVRDILIIAAKRYRVDINEIFNFNMNINSKTSIKFNIIKEELHKKQNFIFSRNQKGFFGEYELFFGIPSILTGIVESDTCKVYYYDFEEYKNLNEETYILNESLKHNSFFKLKIILKRMINVYNSYWKRCHDVLNKKEIENEEMITLKNNEEMELAKKKTVKVFESNSPVKINPNIKDIFISHSTNISTDINISKDDDIENFIKLFLNRNNNNINTKFFRTSLDLIKAKYKSQNININKNKTNRILNIKNSQNFDNNNLQLKTLNNINDNTNIYKRNNFNIKKKFNNNLLLKEFKNTIDAQRVKSKKQIPKIFLPPILKVPENLYNYHIFKTEVYKNNNLDDYKEKEKENSFNKSIDRTSIGNSSRSIEIKNKTKIKKMKTLNLRVAQFNSMRYRIEKLQKRSPKLYMNISYSK